MRAQMLLVLMCSAVLAWAAQAAGRDIFVDNRAGDDRFTGHSPKTSPDRSGPVRTIEKALRLAQQGDRIVVEKTDQPYRESLSLMGSRHSGFPDQPFVLAGNGAVLDGSTPVPPKAWEHFRGSVFRFRPPRVEYQQLFLNDRPLARVASPLTDEPPKLDPLAWCLHRGYIYFAVEPTKLPADYALSYAGKPAGISLLAVHHVVIQDFTVQGYQLDGVNVLNSSKMVRLVGITARGNGRAGVVVGGASTLEIVKGLLGNNGSAQLLTLPISETHLRGTELLANTAPGWVRQGGRVFQDGQEIRQPANTSPAKPATK